MSCMKRERPVDASGFMASRANWTRLGISTMVLVFALFQLFVLDGIFVLGFQKG